MTLFRSLGLAAALVSSVAAAAQGECPGEDTRRFRLDLDWERATRAGETGRQGSLFRAASRQPGRTALRDCLLLAALDPRRRNPASGGSPAARASRSGAPAAPEQEIPSWLRPFSFFVSLAGVYDSNINHDEVPVEDRGAAVGVGTRYKTGVFEAEYEVASHSYTNTDRWDRISQSLTTSLEQRIARGLSVEAVGEVTLKGSSEDRDLGDQYVLEPRIHYRFSRSNRLRLYGAHRLRRYDDVQRDATNQYFGAEFRQLLGTGILDFGYRWERNRAEGPRHRYDRQTYGAEYSTPLAGGLHRLALQIKYRPQQYEARFVDDEEDEGLRRDARWVFSAGANLSLGRHIEVVPTYKFESRSSNDPEKKFQAHRVYLGLRYWFGNRGNPFVERRRAAKTPAPGTSESRFESERPRPDGSAPDGIQPASLSPGARPPAAAAPPPRAARAEEPGGRLRFFRGSVLGCSGAKRRPLPGARVRLVGSSSSHSVETSATGEFVFHAVPASSYELRVEAARESRGLRHFRSRIDLARSVSGYVATLDCEGATPPLDEEE